MAAASVNAIIFLSVAMGIVLVRVGWAGRTALAILGWLIAAAALTALAWRLGAWGVATGTVAAMTVALAALSGSGGKARAKPRRPARDLSAAAAAAVPLRLARRVSVFVLVVPAGGAAALWMGFGAQAAARYAGLVSADANAGLLLLLPALWSVLLVWQMTRNGPRQMIAPPLIAGCVGTALWALR